MRLSDVGVALCKDAHETLYMVQGEDRHGCAWVYKIYWERHEDAEILADRVIEAGGRVRYDMWSRLPKSSEMVDAAYDALDDVMEAMAAGDWKAVSQRIKMLQSAAKRCRGA